MARKLSGWGYVYRVADGELVSEGTVIADPLPDGLAVLEAKERHDPATQRWDPPSRAIVAIQDADRAAALVSQADAALARAKALDPAVSLDRTATVEATRTA